MGEAGGHGGRGGPLLAQRRWLGAAGTVAVVVVAVVIGLIARDGSDGDGDEVDRATVDSDRADDAGARGSSEATTTSTTDRTTVPEPSPPGVPLVVASKSGVQVFDADGSVRHVVSESPAIAAYGVGTDLVVFQRDLVSGLRFLQVWSNGDVTDLPIGADANRARLLDAGAVEGRPVALVSETSGGGPIDTYEELVLLDLETADRWTLVRRDGWESGHYAARLVPERDVIGIMAVSVADHLVRWTDGAQQAWSVGLGEQAGRSLVVAGDEVWTIDVAFVDDFTVPALTVTEHDPSTGQSAHAREVRIDDSDGVVESGLVCTELLAPDRVACSQSGGPPVVVDLSNGSVDVLPGADSARPTVVRSVRR